MQLEIDSELSGIFEEIRARKLTLEEWSKAESSNEFQTAHYCGGFDTIELEFCFSYYDDQGQEYWFQNSLEERQNENTPLVFGTGILF